MRDRYGRHLFGQSALIARRLVEAGVRFVTLHYDACDGYGWDSHVHSDDVKNHLMPTFDQALSGAPGRSGSARAAWLRPWSSPWARWAGRPWPRLGGAGATGAQLFPAVLAGAGIRGGTVFGTSDKDAAHPIDHPVSPESLAATIYQALGISPELRLPDPQGRPTPIVVGGQSILTLLS